MSRGEPIDWSLLDERLVALCREGKSAREICVALNLKTTGAVANRIRTLREQGVVLPSRSKARPGNRSRLVAAR